MEQLYKYRSLIQEIPTIRKDLTELQSLWSIPDSEMRQIRLIIEEIFSNVIRYAFSDSQEHMVEVQLKKSNDEISIQIKDDGIPFNPLEHQPGVSTDPASSVDGGMGLTLIKTFSNSITYKRVDNNNQLLITKKIKSNKPSGL
jgi:anti-sigma regulatory factor (Ser/Thr protein kinase)